MPASVLNNKDDFDKALETKGKYVFVYIHDGSGLSENAEKGLAKFEETTAFYTKDAGAEPKVKDFFKVSALPAAVIFKDGQEVKKVEGVTHEHFPELGAFLKA